MLGLTFMSNADMNPFDFSWMTGRHVQISFSEPETWFVDFGDLGRITVDCPWRLIHEGTIAVSSDDHRQQFGLPAPIDAAEEATSLLAGVPVQGVELREGTADLFIDFERDLRLEIIPFSSGYESWQVSTPSGKHVVAQGGGQLSAW
jgi:uncharacterized protein DUF6188